MIAFWWEDWPGSSLRPGWSGLLDTGLVIIAGTLLAMLGQIVAAGLVIGMLFDGWIRSRIGSFLIVVLLAAALYVVLTVCADNLSWTKATPQDWVGHVALNSIGTSVVLYIGIGRRWPFSMPDEASSPA